MKYGIARQPRTKPLKNPALFRYPSLSRRISVHQEPTFSEKVKALNSKDKNELRSIIKSLVIPAKDGETPNNERLLSMITPLIPKTQKIKDPVPYDPSPLLNKISELEKSLKNLEDNTNRAVRDSKGRQKMNHGGGHTIKSSATVTVARNSDGTVSLTASGGFTVLAATGTINNSNTVFSFTQKPTYIVANGQWMRENFGWTWSNPNATLSGIVGTGGDIYGIA